MGRMHAAKVEKTKSFVRVTADHEIVSHDSHA